MNYVPASKIAKFGPKTFTFLWFCTASGLIQPSSYYLIHFLKRLQWWFLDGVQHFNTFLHFQHFNNSTVNHSTLQQINNLTHKNNSMIQQFNNSTIKHLTLHQFNQFINLTFHQFNNHQSNNSIIQQINNLTIKLLNTSTVQKFHSSTI